MKTKLAKKRFILIVSALTLIIVLAVVFGVLAGTGVFTEKGSIYRKTYGKKGFYKYYIEGKNVSGTYAVMTFDVGVETFDIEIYLNEKTAPITVANFVKYAESGFYDGTIIHRVVKNAGTFQGGTYVAKNDVKANSEAPIVGEFKSNPLHDYSYNDMTHAKGVISMARTSAINSATSGFFICCKDYPAWDGDYAAFGFITNDEDIEKICKVFDETITDSKDFPVSTITLKSVKIIKK